MERGSTDGASFLAAFARPGTGDSEALARLLRDMQRVPAVQELKERAFDHLRIRPGSRVLDVGSGLGEDVERLSRIVAPGGEAVGAEPNEQLLERARTERRGSFVRAGSERLPFEDGCFDACRADRVVGYFPDPVGALREMARVVRPGGPVMVAEMRFTLNGAAQMPGEGHHLLFERLYGGRQDEGWIGLFLPLLMERAGLRDVAVHEAARRVDDPTDVRRCVGLDAALMTADPPTAARLHAWGGQLDEQLAAGRVWLTLQYFSFVGRA